MHHRSLCFLALAAVLLATGPALAALRGLPPLPGARTAPSQASAAPAPTAGIQNAPKVTVSASLSLSAVAPGDRAAIAVVLQHADEWHTWPSKEQDVLPPEIAEFAIRTKIAFIDPPAWLTKGPIQWPEPKLAPVPDLSRPGKSIDVPTYKDRAIAFVPVRIEAPAPVGEHIVRLLVSYQSCNATVCEIPEDAEVQLLLRVAPASAPNASAQADLFTGLDPTLLERIPASGAGATPATTGTPTGPAPTPAGSTFFGLSLGGLTGPTGFAVLALLGVLGGFILNLTPCVLPVIPIKILTLTGQAQSRTQAMVLGLWMGAGVVGFWLALGLLAASVSAFADPSRLFGIWWVTAGLGLVIALMGLGIMGLFSINLPQAVYLINPEAKSPGGSFMFGVMTAVLGLPCFGFVAGALLPTAAAIGAPATITVFAAMGFGMALPYLVLAAKPEWVERVPRTGPASELVKQVMGLLLLAAAAFFVGSGLIALVQEAPYLGTQLHWWGVAAFALLAGAWLAVRTIQISPRAVPRAVFGVLGLVVAAAGVAPALLGTQKAAREHAELQARLEAAGADGLSGSGPVLVSGVWLAYSDALLAQALSANKTVVMDFTAEWCLNCKALKAAVLEVPPVRPALDVPDVVMLKVDLTSTKAPGWAKLRALGQTGIPLLAIQGPGKPEPWLSNAYTSDQVLAALAQARGPSGDARTAAAP